MGFAENLQAIRRDNHLSQEELAEMLGVSRQAVSKWEQGNGYPEVEKLLVLSERLGVSLDHLMGTGDTADSNACDPADADVKDTIRIVSPHEGVTLVTSRVMRSQQFWGGKNSPKYALFAADPDQGSAWGAQNIFLAWYRNLDDVTREIDEIVKALAEGRSAYTLQYSVKCKQNLLRTIEE